MKGTVAAIVAALVIVSVMAWVKVSVWQECRADHSFFYCLHLIGN